MILVDEPNTLIIFSKRSREVADVRSPNKSGEGISYEDAADVVEDSPEYN